MTSSPRSSRPGPDEPFPEPRDTTTDSDKPILRGVWQGGETSVDPVSGKTSVVANIHSLLYWVDKTNPRGPQPTNPQEDPQFAAWEYSVQQWAAAHGIVNGETITQ